MQIDKFDLAKYGVPPEAIAIMFTWKVIPLEGQIRLMRTRDDTEPMSLTGQGSGHIGLVEPQTLYLGTEETTGITFSITGHETIEGL